MLARTNDTEIVKTLDLCSRPRTDTLERGKRQPIEGWLTLPALGLFLSPFKQIAELLSTWQLIHSGAGRSALAIVEGLRFAIFAELALGAVYLLLTVYVSWIFLKRKRTTPVAFMALMLALLAYTVIDEFVLGRIVGGLPDTAAILRSGVCCAVWIPYFGLSKRVKNTFVVD